MMINPILACPYCVGRDLDNPATWVLLGAFVLLPFVISAIGIWIIRKSQLEVIMLLLYRLLKIRIIMILDLVLQQWTL